MYKPKNMRLNKFVDVAIPKNSDFFARLNGVIPSFPNNAYSGDSSIPMTSERKVDILADMEQYDKMMQRKEFAESQRSED